MANQRVTFQLPADIVAGASKEDLAKKAKESLVMQLDREQAIPLRKAAEVLGLKFQSELGSDFRKLLDRHGMPMA